MNFGRLRPCLWRTAGFALPTVVLVISLHLAERPTTGEAVDGLISGLWFAALFLLATLVRPRLGLAPAPASGARPVWEFLLGALAAVVVWSLLWLFWSVAPLAAGAEGVARILNATAVFVSGLAAPVLHSPAGVTTKSGSPPSTV